MAVWLGTLFCVAQPASAASLGVSMASFDDNFLTTVRSAMQARARELGVAILLEDAQNDIGRQLSQVQNFIAQRVDAVIVNPVDTDATPRITRLVSRAGIPLVYVNRMPADRQLPARVSFVGSDETQSGTLQMTQMCRLLHGRGSVLIIMGELTNQAARQRTQDVYDVIARPECRGIQVLDKQSANWQRTEAADLMTNWISAGLRASAVVANNDEMAIGAIQALKRARLLSQTLVAGIDATADALVFVKKGMLAVTVFQNGPGQGRAAVDTALALVNSVPVERFVRIPFQLVTAANLADFSTRR